MATQDRMGRVSGRVQSGRSRLFGKSSTVRRTNSEGIQRQYRPHYRKNTGVNSGAED